MGPDSWHMLLREPDLRTQLICLATVFAVDKGYATVAELPGYRRCAVVELGPTGVASR